MKNKELEESFHYWRKRVFATLWITYGAFYLCRVNLSIALPGIMKEFGYSKTDVGLIGSILFVTYAIGQFINGQLGDKFGARKLITLGIVVSAILNLIFGFSKTFLVMAVVWGLNGYFQSMGHPPSVKTLANWFPTRSRGKISGLYASSFQVGNVVTWLFTGYLCSRLGWRSAFWIPSILFLICGIQFYKNCRNSPEDVGLPPIEEYERRKQLSIPNEAEQIGKETFNRDEHLGFRFTLKQTIGNPKLWRVGLSYLFLGLVTFGFIYWVPTYILEVQRIGIASAAAKAVLFPLAGAAGALTAGWVTDKFFASRRTPMIVVMAFLSGIFILIYPRIPAGNNLLNLLCLSIIGFMAFGAHTTMVTAIPMDYGTRKAASSATGFIDAFGYIGATISGVGAGWLVDNYGWNSVFYFWAGSAFLACIPILRLWSYRPPKTKYI